MENLLTCSEQLAEPIVDDCNLRPTRDGLAPSVYIASCVVRPRSPPGGLHPSPRLRAGPGERPSSYTTAARGN